MCAHVVQKVFIEILRPFITFTVTLHFTDHFKMDLMGCHIAFKLSIYFYKSLGKSWRTFGNGIPKDFYEDLRDILIDLF